MLNCWKCKYILTGKPDSQLEPEEEEASDVVATCPKCLTRHIYAEDEDGHMVIIEAIDTDDRILHRPSD